MTVFVSELLVSVQLPTLLFGYVRTERAVKLWGKEATYSRVNVAAIAAAEDGCVTLEVK